MRNKTYIWDRFVQKALEIAYIAALCVFMVLFLCCLSLFALSIHWRIVPLEGWRRMGAYEEKTKEETPC